MKNITVIGSGTMGNGIAHVFAQNNYNVNLIDVNETQLKKAIEIAFVDDELLLNKFHIIKTGLKDAVNDTKENILDFKKIYGAEYYILN
jgi:3-hydroxybutyryl-CoA dehydrogenase